MTMRLPSGLKATLDTSRSHLRARTSWPFSASHTLTVPSRSAGDDAFAVGAERHAPDRGRVPLEGEEFLARPGVPHLRLALRAPALDSPTHQRR